MLSDNIVLFALILMMSAGGDVNITQTLLLLALLSASGTNGCTRSA